MRDSTDRPDTPAPAPLLIAPANALQMTGLRWPYLRRLARELGIPVIELGPRKHAIEAASLLAALKARAPAEPPAEPTENELAEQMRERLRRAG